MISSSIQDISFFAHEKKLDHRGYFQRISDQNEIKTFCAANFIQSSVSFNSSKGTIRGLHFQAAPSKEWKYVTCIKGAAFDCVVDLRKESPTYGEHLEFELTQDNGISVLIPPGVAHGFQTLENETLISYQMTDVFDQSLVRTLRWNDDYLGIKWPLEVTQISKSDFGGLRWPVTY
jgi:dTDP-4-dehydrorhamnose 3,5-epimerase